MFTCVSPAKGVPRAMDGVRSGQRHTYNEDVGIAGHGGCFWPLLTLKRARGRHWSGPQATKQCPSGSFHHRGRCNWALPHPGGRGKSGTGDFWDGTTKVCQIMPRYLRVQSHFSRCHVFGLLACTVPLCPATKHPEATLQTTVWTPPRNNRNQPKARRKQQPSFTVYATSCGTVWEL